MALSRAAFASATLALASFDRGGGAVDVRGSAVSIRPRGPYGAHLRSDRPALVDDLALQRVQVGPGFLQRVFVGPWIDLKEQFALFDEGVVLDRKLRDGAVDLGSNADEVGKYLRIIGARVLLVSLITSSPVINAAAMMAMLTILPSVGCWGAGSFSGIASPFRIN